jgi:Protein of unknown function (DUF2865)
MQPAGNTRSAVQNRPFARDHPAVFAFTLIPPITLFFRNRCVTVCGTIGSPTVLRPIFLPTLTLVSCLLFTVPPAGQTGQTQTSDELPGPRLAAAWVFDPQRVPPTIEPAPSTTPPRLNRLRITITRRRPAPESEQLNCVRLCDGFYFPTTKVAKASTRREAGLCNALCPGAKTAVYALAASDGEINAAVSRIGGKAYNSLPTALSYRRSMSPHCSCHQPGYPALALSLDLTLKAGDVVVTDKGVRQFRGSRNFPYAERDFAAYDSGSGMASATLRYLATIDRPYQSKRITAERQRNLSDKFEKGVQLQDRFNGSVDSGRSLSPQGLHIPALSDCKALKRTAHRATASLS